MQVFNQATIADINAAEIAFNASYIKRVIENRDIETNTLVSSTVILQDGGEFSVVEGADVVLGFVY